MGLKETVSHRASSILERLHFTRVNDYQRPFTDTVRLPETGQPLWVRAWAYACVVPTRFNQVRLSREEDGHQTYSVGAYGLHQLVL